MANVKRPDTALPPSMEMHREAGVRVISLRKKFLFGAVMFVGLFLGLETVIRVGAYFLYNRSPYFLYYGFRDPAADDNPEGHNEAFRGYSKFQPHRLLHQYGMFARPTPIHTNSVGLRGPDFVREKPADAFRVICMGESSTFGFFDRDDFTYPALLERRFQQLGGNEGKRVEAINAGIPHANSDNILAMLKGELLSYRPDVLTVYAGFNDAVLTMDENWVQRTLRWMHAHLATYVALKRLSIAFGGPTLYSRWSGYLSDVDAASVQRQIDLHVSRYEHNIREMVLLGRQNGARFIFIKQPITMTFYHPDANWKSLSYGQRVAEARQALQARGVATGDQAVLLVHSALMAVLDRLSGELSVPIVDNIAIMDRHPEFYASYVHITEDGNQALADAIYDSVSNLR
jgi:lysophospholipase L1-like esterase